MVSALTIDVDITRQAHNTVNILVSLDVCMDTLILVSLHIIYLFLSYFSVNETTVKATHLLPFDWVYGFQWFFHFKDNSHSIGNFSFVAVTGC